MHDPLSLILDVRIGRLGLFQIWHKDPCYHGNDSSCYRFLRRMDEKTVDEIAKQYEYDWDNVFNSDSGNTYFRGMFCPNGDPRMSTHGITLNLFFLAAFHIFKKNRRKAWRYINANIGEILFFGENPVDSLFDGINRTFEDGCGEAQTKHRRKERIRRMAHCIYRYIISDIQPWWRHQEWHIHHWRISFTLWHLFRRWAFSRCCSCGGTLGWNKSVSSDWSGKRLTCWRCSQAQCAVPQKAVG